MDIRQEFLTYFESKGHEVVPSSPLVPSDASLLFTNAGMVQFKPVFTGEIPIPNPPRATSSQTCIRAGGKHNDLENVGFTARHHTFFEMLGNFSFGDYFKEDAIRYAWEFVTDILDLDKTRLWVSVHDSDDEAEAIWSRYVPKERIKRMGDKDNFWQMGDTGPCGPCSEIYFDQGEENFNGPEDYFGGDGDRFLEIWNLVFMQYNRTADGVLHPLPKPSIDTGMGLERITAIKEGKLSNYETSLFLPLIHKLEEITGKTYLYATGASYRVIADHIRSVTFLLAQGVNFDKEGRGYVLRRILRRAVRHGYLLGLSEPFMYRVVDTLVALMGESYPYLIEKKEALKELMRLEEERFFATIATGMDLFGKEMATQPSIFSGDVAFKLYDTFGFPLDLTEDMLKGTGIAVDTTRFEALMTEQRTRAKAAWKGSGDAANEGDFKALLEQFGPNTFVGYTTLERSSTILALLDDNFKMVPTLEASSTGWVLLDSTPFYAQSGGQAGDCGRLGDVADVLDTQKFFDLNLAKIEAHAPLKAGMTLQARVDKQRQEIAKHHSATHLLHAVLRETLGEHIAQAGSLVEAQRLRFDFSHPKALTHEEITSIEEKVNTLIEQGIAGQTREMAIDEAKAAGAMALFGEKYGQTVRVVDFGDASIELCGGCHVDSTARIGSFYILKESGVSAGVRRIEAVCGKAARLYANELRTSYETATQEVKNRDLLVGIAKLKEQIKDLKDETSRLKKQASTTLSGETINAITLIVATVDEGDIKEMIDQAKNQYDAVAILLVQPSADKISVAAGIKNAPLKAGEWVREVCVALGGKGGGRDDFASGGGKDLANLESAVARARTFATTKLS